ncbi:MAG: ribonuclease H-like domain-containing protein [Candidatus Beckwithbacteria bacterium]|nr:ribonuclease H-like domain-containing protein [Candidatus Beckwithbacteria bacterium]
MTKLYLDIETLPSGEEMREILKDIYKRKRRSKYTPRTFEEFVESTGLDGSYGRIACISYAVNDEAVKTLSGDEKKMLTDFWAIAKNADLFIGFNLMDFDLRFIYQRSVILGVKPSKDLNFARYRNFPIFDIMCEWSKWNLQSKISLHALSKVLGIPSPKEGEIEGKDVAKAYQAGRIKEICEYCEKDVETTRKIYKKMIFEN